MIYEKKDIEKLLAEMKASFEGGPVKVTIPPPSFTGMKCELELYEKNKRLIISLPVEAHQTNPVGVMQGGYIAAAFDNAFGPFSYLLAKKPVTTIDMNIQYIRGVQVGQRITVEAKLISKGFSTLMMSAEIKNEKQKVVAMATTNLLMIKIPE